MKKFDSEISACEDLLNGTTKILIDKGVNFVVVGGWAPYIFHSLRFGHPGTFDVDILLNSESLDDGTFDCATETLLTSGYLRAPKNKFQAHKIMNVAGEELVFHVDFLNERNPTNEIEMVGGKGKLHSVYTESMKAVFKYNDYRYSEKYPNVPFPSPETFIATKAAAVKVKKRLRDAFDVFITALDGGEIFAHNWKNLCKLDGLFSDANSELVTAIEEGDALEKIQHVLEKLQHIKNSKWEIPSESEIRKAFNFLAAT